jgi:hypothetical protein
MARLSQVQGAAQVSDYRNTVLAQTTAPQH